MEPLRQRAAKTETHRAYDGPSAGNRGSDGKQGLRPLRRGEPSLRISAVKRVLRHLGRIAILTSLLVYAGVLVRKDWPPDARLSPHGSSQGAWWVSPSLTRAERIMLVVAHPDDECLFFSPTLLNLLAPRFVTRPDSTAPIKLESPRGHILSLSSGNAEGLGIKRTREMKASCEAFGIPSTACIVLDHPGLPDSMSVWWPEATIAECVKRYVELWDIDAIITFDHHGVSGHANHRAIATTLSQLAHTDPQFPITFMLRSTWILEKYASLLSLPYSLYRHRRHQGGAKRAAMRSMAASSSEDEAGSGSAIFVSTPAQYYAGRRAFSQHVSQNVWFRWLWLASSRFMWINELTTAAVPL
ncbi:hypothetical protein PCANC_10038 [Puccinia coronata f. sp. avenae]|uniref:N-acetylglucosaminylphosphatidylinositol deacetylase n=1 Tax=Puccinia coronata f. sp. avenae TaxID=200324 RepID=A0A2N5UZ35_9BASI|nr:hypothetical protein PCANC_10038 [Puccinia coronata f. sp. avenae]